MSLLKVAGTTASSGTLYVDDVFSTYLYTGNDTTNVITNNIDLAGKGGLVWIKGRNSAAGHYLIDTVRGRTSLSSENLAGQSGTFTTGMDLASFNSNGFTLGAGSLTNTNSTGNTQVSWTFRKAAKFFDVVTYTGTGSARTIAHSLGVAPGMILVKMTSMGGYNWRVYSRGMTSAAYSMKLNTTDAQVSDSTIWNSTAPTSSVFSIGTDDSVNYSGQTYVAYLFAHDTDADGIIQCGSFTTGVGGKMTAPVNLGWEPQYLLAKNSGASESWVVYDTLRGMSMTGYAALNPNTSGAEYTGTSAIAPTATGFDTPNASGPFANSSTYIYMAIRMPNKPPTSGTQVFSPVSITSSGTTTDTAGFPVDLVLEALTGTATAKSAVDRLRGGGQFLYTNLTNAESDQNPYGALFDNNTSVIWKYTTSGYPMVFWNFKRAPGFFDVVCYTGTGVAGLTVAHNLTVAPELMIIKMRSTDPSFGSFEWVVYHKDLGNNYQLELNSTIAKRGPSPGMCNNTTPTSTVFTLGTDFNVNDINGGAQTYVAYLFATLAGISKVGSYTGNGSTGQAIACGFSAGARFVLIKRTDDAGDWYTFDSARGLTSGSSPYLLLNSTAAETTGNNGVYASTGGFTLATSAAGLNASGGTYIFLAVA